jgi:thiosulfate dehydrogenase [quinone] large subunit
VGSTDAVAANPAVVARSPAVVRIATAFIFLWAFLDKASGRHYATGDTWGLGRIWARIPLASHNRWLL